MPKELKITNPVVDITGISESKDQLYGLPEPVIRKLCDETSQVINLEPIYIEKDIHVTEALRHATHQSQLFPNTRSIFKGGTALAKAGLVHRFSEDVDVNIAPLGGHPASDEERVELCTEIVRNLTRNTPLSVEEEKYKFNRFARAMLKYDSLYLEEHIKEHSGNEEDIEGIETVQVDWLVRYHAKNYIETRSVSSYIGETASQTHPELLEQYPVLQSFQVHTSAPLITIVDKLDAIHWRGESGEMYGLRNRARDFLDIAVLLSNPDVRATVNAEIIDALHAEIVATMPSNWHRPRCERPEAGFAASPAFQPGHRACEIVRQAYPRLERITYHADSWLEFDEALAVIRDSQDIL